MIAKDEDALICDFAQYYHVYDYRQLPVDTIATLAFGLPDESRIKKVLSGQRWSLDTLLLAAILDNIRNLSWMFSKDGQKNKNRPKSILQQLNRGEEPERMYKSVEEFEKMWEEEING